MDGKVSLLECCPFADFIVSGMTWQPQLTSRIRICNWHQWPSDWSHTFQEKNLSLIFLAKHQQLEAALPNSLIVRSKLSVNELSWGIKLVHRVLRHRYLVLPLSSRLALPVPFQTLKFSNQNHGQSLVGLEILGGLAWILTLLRGECTVSNPLVVACYASSW